MIKAEFAPDGVYTRHSEGAFLRLNDGSILFIYSRFTEQNYDDAPSDLAGSVSYDEGESWSEPVTLIKAEQYGARNIMSVSLMRMQNGDVGCFYIVKESPESNVIMLSRSNDEGRTFYRHVQCSLADRRAIYVLNNDRVIRLKSGRLYMPLTYHRGMHKTHSGLFFEARGAACGTYSDDDGETWREAADVVWPPFTGSHDGLQENGVVELKDNVLMGFSRTDMCFQYSYISVDGGDHWTAAQPSRFTSPCSPMGIKRNPYTGELLAVWNPIPNYNGRELKGVSAGRTPLVYSISEDDGATWSKQVVIEDDETRGYCYTALFFTKDSSVLAAYCAGGPEDHGYLCRLRINKIKL